MTAAVSEPPVAPLQRPVATLRGVGRERAAQLARLEILTIEDLLLHRPRRYEDRTRFRAIRDLELNEPAIARGTIVALGVKWFRQHTQSIFELVLEDGTSRLHCRWWNLPFMENYFRRGDEVIVFGRPKNLRPRTMDHPETEVVETGEESSIHMNRITPVYPLTEGLPQRWLRGLIWRTLAEFGSHLADPWPELRAVLPGGRALPARPQAIRWLHFPELTIQADLGRSRLALDDFIRLQLQLLSRRRKFESRAKALPCPGDNRLMRPFLHELGFKLTGAQTTVLREIRRDLAGAHPMRRLLQGDVGSGKTVVAACAALMALESGYSAAVMAPTEILAEQHARNFRRWFEPLGVPVQLRTGSHKDQATALEISGAPALVAGTHALLKEGFDIPNLGLVIIDEQHKFGVGQREDLVRKGIYPHLLVMTATPIPRTLGLTVYGELDVSIIGESPPGRGRLQTFIRGPDKLPKVWEFVRSQLKAGRQAYVVYPRVEDSGDAVKAVTKEFAAVQEAVKPFKAGLLHGRVKPAEKEAVLSAFRDRQIEVLLATSLIEVGVDVPNATVMLIENAEQFGLAQLHQLRGRIGRGADDAYCILVTTAKGREAQERLRVLERTNDGFEISEADLALRGPGELLGQQQSGTPRFRFGDLQADGHLLLLARRLAEELLASAS